MANLISVERACLTFGTTQVLNEVSLGVGEGDRIGIVGRNGGGKTSLLNVLTGEQEPDSGRVTRARGTSLGVLAQDDPIDPEASVRDAVLGALADHEWASVAPVREILAGLLGGLDAAGVGGLDARVGGLSGGERRRVALAGLLIADPTILFLDEPTNHLDVEGVAWLADHLTARGARADRALVVITHDRWFLDAVALRTWEVADGAVHLYDGGYAAFVLARAERQRVAAVTADRRDNLLRKELAWLRRGPPARTSKPRFRIDAANALIADEPPPRDNVELTRFATARLGKTVVDLHEIRLTVGDRVLLDRVTWLLAPGERVGIVGVNGSGKTTLLRAIAGLVPLAAGRRKEGPTVRLRFLTQEVRELDTLGDRRVIEALEEVRASVRVGRQELSAAQLAQRLGFTGPRQQTRVGDLSGGERRRLQLTRLLLDEPNVLLLDEPTNDLDLETLTSLEDLLDGWPGTLVVVSHDRYLLERVCDRQVALLGDGRLRDLPGGVEEYLHIRSVRLAADGAGPGSVTAASSAGRIHGPSVTDALAQREARKTLARVERQLSRLAEREARLHEAMAAAAADHQAALALDADLRALIAEREDLEAQWLEAAEHAE